MTAHTHDGFRDFGFWILEFGLGPVRQIGEAKITTLTNSRLCWIHDDGKGGIYYKGSYRSSGGS